MAEDLEAFVEGCHRALLEIIRGDAEPWSDLFSRREDVTLGNPFGPFARGWNDVMATARRAAALYRDGQVVGFDRVAAYETAELACVVEVERFQAKVGGSEESVSVGLRVTNVFRRENGDWKLVHRHADPITTPQPPESVVRAGGV
jgi:ketosteroid isomerase-like protein